MRNKLIPLFLLSLLLRVLLINTAFHGDLNNNISWGNMALTGLNGFFEKKGFDYSIPNQPPLYILLFALTSFLYKTIANLSWYLNNRIGIFPSSFIWFWQQNAMTILVKLPSIFADLGIGVLIYKTTKYLKLNTNLTFLWLFNPITFYNSSIWGQTDPIVNFLGLTSVYFLIKNPRPSSQVNKNLIYSMFFLTLSLLFKGSLVIFVPILLTYAILQKYNFGSWIKAVLISSAVAILIIVWFHSNLDLPIWIINLYTKQILPGEIGNLSANAFNFWYLINPGKVLDSVKYFGLSARLWGYSITITFIAIIIFKLRQDKSIKALLYSLAMTAFASFLFMTRIHERYLYPFFPLATILIGFIPELIFPYIILSIIFLLNMYNLFWAPGIPALENILRTTQFTSILAVINLVIFVILLYPFLKLKKI